MKKYIKSTIDWYDLSSSEQMAVEYASQAYEGGGYNLDDAVRKGCNQVSWGNVEPEYVDEDFYGAEPNEDNVFNYLFDKYTREGRKIYRNPYINASASIDSSSKPGEPVRSVRASSSLDSQRQQYVYRCLEDMPEVPNVDADEYPEKWSQYHHDAYEYRMWCFADAVEDGLFEEDDWNEFKRLWDTGIADLAAPWS